MKLYFVRHGETTANALKLTQNIHAKLSNLGLKQAKFVAKRFTKIPIDVILSSPNKRTEQTAQIINQVLKKEIIYLDLLREIKRPTQIEGLHFQNPQSVKIHQQISQNYHDPNWHYSDEENFFDLKKRAVEFLGYLEKLEDENILIITHGIFLKILIFTLAFDDLLTPDLFKKINSFFKTQNTSITLLEKEEGKWLLKTWSDYAHLG